MQSLYNKFWSKLSENTFLAIVFSAFSYILFAKLTLHFSSVTGLVWLIWPAAGISFALVLLLGYRVWPGIFIGTLISSLHDFNLIFADPMVILEQSRAIFSPFGSTIQAVMGAWLVRKFGDYPQTFINPKKIVRFYILAGVVSTTISPTIHNIIDLFYGTVKYETLFLEWIGFWVGDMTSIFIFSTIIISLVKFEKEREILISSLMILTFSLSVGIYSLALTWEDERLDLLFEQQIIAVRDAIKVKEEDFQSLLVNISGLEKSHQDLTKENFRRFSEEILPSTPSLRALNYTEIVTAEQREYFTDKLSLEYGKDIKIWYFGDNQRLTSEQKDHYSVVKYIEPQEVFDLAPGFDVSADPMRNAALEYAITYNNAAMTAPVYIPALAKSKVIILYYAIRRDNVLIGFSSIIVDAEMMVAEILDKPFAKDLTLTILDEDVTGNSQPVFKNSEDIEKIDKVYPLTLQILNRVWNVEIDRKLSFKQHNSSMEPMLIGMSAMIIASLIAMGIVIMSGQKLLLEEKVKKRTIALEEASKIKSEFIANMSHDLRTPLNAIIGFSEIIMKEMFGPIGSERYKEYVENINSSSDYLLSLINDLLDFSAIEAGKRYLTKVNIEPTLFIEECYQNLFSLSFADQLVCKLEVDKNVDHIFADEKALRQIMINLISNSIKFTPNGGIIKTIVKKTDTWTIIKVSDTGEGIDPIHIKDILDPFTRVENNPLITHEGTGLGLAIVNSLVKLHDGEITIESNRNSGTIVTIKLPLF